MPHSSIFLIVYFPHLPLQHIPFLLVYFTFSHSVSSALYCFASVRCFSPPLDYWYTSFFLLAGPGSVHEVVVSAFSRNPLGREYAFSLYFFSLPAVYFY